MGNNCWVAGLLGCWVAGLLGCWVAGLLGLMWLMFHSVLKIQDDARYL